MSINKIPWSSRRYANHSADKVQMRQMAAEVGVLKQPLWRPLSSFNGAEPHTISFTGFDFSKLPLEELQSSDAKVRSLLFESLEQGFRIAAYHDVFVVESRASLVRSVLGITNTHLELSREELTERLAQLEKSSFKVKHLASFNPTLSTDILRSELRHEPDGMYFLKDINGSRGYHVARIHLKDGAVTQVDLPACHYEMMSNRGINLCRPPAPSELFEYLTSSEDPIGAPIKNPMIERAIATQTIEGVWAEPRALFYSNGGPVYLCSYSKLGREAHNVVPNRAQGGDAEPIYNSFHRILSARTELRGAELEVAIANTIARYKDQVQLFAREYMRVANKQLRFYGPLYAIDVCPVWAEEAGEIEFYLLEVQAGPGTVGAYGNLPQDEQAHVDRYNREVEERESMEFEV
jgi:hypothetical protein